MLCAEHNKIYKTITIIGFATFTVVHNSLFPILAVMFQSYYSIEYGSRKLYIHGLA